MLVIEQTRGETILIEFIGGAVLVQQEPDGATLRILKPQALPCGITRKRSRGTHTPRNVQNDDRV